ncbi:MAG: uroporphyrinogen decarboxylase family protein [Candidatus Bathyarchaeota archaeon]|jgi:[methyl-Co(III) methanol-specific corrinoid protein]:coenzyme M methyltransferase
MNPYERLIAVLEGNKGDIDRLPVWCSTRTFTLDSMKTFDAYWPEAHKDPEKMARLAAGVHELTGSENMSVPFDMTLEAEALGAPCEYFEGKVKWISVKKFIASDIDEMDIPEDPSEFVERGRIPVSIEAIKTLKKSYGGKVPVVGIVNCPFTSIGSYVINPIEFHKSMIKEPEKIHRIYETLNPYYAAVADAFKEAGADIIVFTEEGASLNNISPRHFDEFVKPHLSELINMISPPRVLHICGSLISRGLEVITSMIDCGAEAITMDEKTSMLEARKIADEHKPDYILGGNIDPYKVIHGSSVEVIRDRVKQVIDEGTDMVCPGCDYWIETPREHIKAFVSAAIEYGTRMQSVPHEKNEKPFKENRL